MSLVQPWKRNASGEELFIIVDDAAQIGYLCGCGRYVEAGNVNRMIRYGRGLVYVCITEATASRLRLPPMPRERSGPAGKTFAVSVDHETCSTGISAFERANTIRAFLDPAAEPAHFRRPGHLFPLICEQGGLLKRPGIAEAAVELALWQTGEPVAYACEILNDAGAVARPREIRRLANELGIRKWRISDIVELRLNSPDWPHWPDWQAEGKRAEAPNREQTQTVGGLAKPLPAEAVQLPDLLFVRLCEERFGINRGIYNSVDAWFFQKGLTDVTERRERVAEFLAGIGQSGGVPFRRRGLASQLNDFWNIS